LRERRSLQYEYFQEHDKPFNRVRRFSASAINLLLANKMPAARRKSRYFQPPTNAEFGGATSSIVVNIAQYSSFVEFGYFKCVQFAGTICRLAP
jgi:hypothetical protein